MKLINACSCITLLNNNNNNQLTIWRRDMSSSSVTSNGAPSFADGFKQLKEVRMQGMNKAGYTATEVARGWERAVIKKQGQKHGYPSRVWVGRGRN